MKYSIAIGLGLFLGAIGLGIPVLAQSSRPLPPVSPRQSTPSPTQPGGFDPNLVRVATEMWIEGDRFSGWIERSRGDDSEITTFVSNGSVDLTITFAIDTYDCAAQSINMYPIHSTINGQSIGVDEWGGEEYGGMRSMIPEINTLFCETSDLSLLR